MIASGSSDESQSDLYISVWTTIEVRNTAASPNVIGILTHDIFVPVLVSLVLWDLILLLFLLLATLRRCDPAFGGNGQYFGSLFLFFVLRC